MTRDLLKSLERWRGSRVPEFLISISKTSSPGEEKKGKVYPDFTAVGISEKDDPFNRCQMTMNSVRKIDDKMTES